LTAQTRLATKPGLDGAASDHFHVSSQLLQRDRPNDDEDGDSHQRVPFDDQRLALAQAFEGVCGLRRASKAGGEGRDVIAADPVHRSGGESVRAHAPYDLDVHNNVERRRGELHAFKEGVSVGNGTEVAYAKYADHFALVSNVRPALQ
jgi:hypothetical protein